MPSDASNRQRYLHDNYAQSLDKWTDDPNSENTIKLGWAIMELETMLRDRGSNLPPFYPNEYFRHLHTMDARTLWTVPSEIMETALELEPSMARHFGLTRTHPVVIFKERNEEGDNRGVIYFGGNL